MCSRPMLAAIAGILCASIYLGCCTKPAQDGSETAPGHDAQTGSAPAAGMKAYVDPDTGKLTDTPPPGTEPIPGDVLTPPPGAVEKPAPGGGVQLDLRPEDDESDPDE